MDLSVFAAAAGVGYVAKFLQDLSGKKEGSSEPSLENSIYRQSKSQNLLQQIWDQICPFRRLVQRGLEGDVFSVREGDVSPGKCQKMNRFGGGLPGGNASMSGIDAEVWANVGNYEICIALTLASLLPGLQQRERIEGNTGGICGRNEFLDNSGDVLPELETTKFTRNRALRSRRPCGVSAKPLNSLESCLTADLSREQAVKEENVFGSLPPLSEPSLVPLLVTDGNRVISRVSTDCVDRGEHMTMQEGGISLDENNTLFGSHLCQKTRPVELPRKQKRRDEKGRLSSLSARSSGGPFHSLGSPNGMLLFFIGISIGIKSATMANQREVDNLNELLKQSENLAQDLQEELEMNNMLTVKEISNEYNQSQETLECSSCNRGPGVSSSEQELEESTKYKSKESEDQKVENPELISKIEAELEVELEMLELNMKSSNLERLADFIELDQDFEEDVVQGELKVDGLEPGATQSESDSDASGTSNDHTHTPNYAVSPWELSLRLHEVIESRLEARIKELEAMLQNSQKRMRSLERPHWTSQTGFVYGEVGSSSSTLGTPTNINEVGDTRRLALGD